MPANLDQSIQTTKEVKNNNKHKNKLSFILKKNDPIWLFSSSKQDMFVLILLSNQTKEVHIHIFMYTQIILNISK